jgi:hypothetical protein
MGMLSEANFVPDGRLKTRGHGDSEIQYMSTFQYDDFSGTGQ